MKRSIRSSRAWVLALTCGFIAAGAQAETAVPRSSILSEALRGLDPRHISTGILYDRVLPLSAIEEYDGTEPSRPISASVWRQIHHEMTNASLVAPGWPDLSSLRDVSARFMREGTIPIALMNIRYNRIRPEALTAGMLEVRAGRLVEVWGDPYRQERVFASAALRAETFRGNDVVFRLDRRLHLTNDDADVTEIAVDFADGRGFVGVEWDRRQPVSYACPGRKTLQVRMSLADGSVLWGSFVFDVVRLQTPAPDDTLVVTATIPYAGGYGSGEAYVYLSDQHTSLTDPVVVIEGFDLDNSMNWDELYALLNQEGLVDSLRADGFDAVVLNFTDSTDYIQRNAYAIVELIQMVQARIAAGVDLALVGASMGGLAARYALAYMESQAFDHRVRTFISFDAPQRGANIPLGIQYWLDFFSGQSADAAFLLSRLDTPAALQMLLYHHTSPPGSTGESDPMRAQLLTDLETLGSYPQNVRLVAVANGSGQAADQGYAAGAQIIHYEYTSLLVDIIGNVWAVPDGMSQVIFDGLIDLFWPLPDDQLVVAVSGTRPYDNAPGGWRSSMAQMDSTEAPYGDVVALYDSHCFIPSISSLAIETDDPFYDIDGDPDLMAKTPFAAVYYPDANQEHVSITAENAVWFRQEIRRDATGIGSEFADLAARPLLYQNRPNPFNPVTAVRFDLPRPERVRLEILSLAGRRLIVLQDGLLPPGRHEILWDGRDAGGQPVASGVYFYRLIAGSSRMARTMALIK